jgi:DNA-directed RNA polymerase specialized sigma24 family protein
MANVVARSFRTAYLLTNSAEEAESAVLAGIESWNPDGESDEALFHKVMCAAAHRRHQWEPPVRTEARLWLPEELRVVLTLAPPIRRCFVLRNLAGLSAQLCARLLGLLPDQVDEYAGAAHRCLAAL